MASKIGKDDEAGVYYFDTLKVRVVNTKSIPRKVRVHHIEYVQNGFVSNVLQKVKPKRFWDFQKVKEFSRELKNSEDHIFVFDKESLRWLRPEGIQKLRVIIVDNTGRRFHSRYQKLPEEYELENSPSIDTTIFADI